MSAPTTVAPASVPANSAAPPAAPIVCAGALLQGMTLVSVPAVSAMLKQTLAHSDGD